MRANALCQSARGCVRRGFQISLVSVAAAILLGAPPTIPMNWLLFNGGPGARDQHVMAYDETRQQVVLFGGENSKGTLLNDTWVWDGSSWTQKSPVHHPSARLAPAMAYDENNQQTVLFGGSTSGGALVNDTWLWDGTDWTQATPTHIPAVRYAQSMAYDGAEQRVVMFGGLGNPQILGDTWIWDGADWTNVTPASNNPGARYASAMAYDSVHQQVVMFSGSNIDDLADTWVWNGTAWSQKGPTNSPPMAVNPTLTYDAARSQVVLYGGYTTKISSDTWTWDGTNWTKQSPATVPTPLFQHAAAYDSNHQVTVVFGGLNASIADSNQTWLWYPVPSPVSVTIAASGAAATFSVSGGVCQAGTGYTVPQTLMWTPGFSCTVNISPPAAAAGTQYVLTEWADGSTDNPRAFAVPASTTTYTADYTTQYLLTTVVSPSGAGTVTGAGYYNQNASASVGATANTNYRFVNWTGPVTQAATTASNSVSMTQPQTVTANFLLVTGTTVASATGGVGTTVMLSATITPAGASFGGSLQFQVDSVNVGSAISVTGSGMYTTNYLVSGSLGMHTIGAAFTSSSSSVLGSSNTNTLTVTVGPATHLVVTAPASTPAGAPFSFTVTAQDAGNNTATGYTGTVHFTSTDNQASLPANSTLTNGAGTFTARLKTVGPQTITAIDISTVSIMGTSGLINVYPLYVYTADTYNNRIEVFDTSGNYIRQFGSQGNGNGQFSGPVSIAEDSGENLWVVDLGNNRLEQFNNSGTYLTQFGSTGSGPGQFNYPTSVAIDSSGNLFVLDGYNGRVQKFTSTGGYLLQFGNAGSGTGQFGINPSNGANTVAQALAIDASNHVWVADTYNNRVEEFDDDGNFLGQFGNGVVSTPKGIAVDSVGNIWVSNFSSFRVEEFAPNGTLLAQVGTAGSGTGQFSGTTSLTFDAAGNLWVSDGWNARVEEFSGGGSFELQLGGGWPGGSGNGQFGINPSPAQTGLTQGIVVSR